MSNKVIKFPEKKLPKTQLVIEVEAQTLMGLRMSAKSRKMMAVKSISMADIEEQAAIDLDEIWRLKDEDGNLINEDD